MIDDLAARDLDDARLIERGEYARLLERYRPLIRRGAGMYVHGADADDVTGEVILYLYAQLEDGRRFDVPFRVVAFNRARWMAKDFLKRQKDVPVPELVGAGSWSDDTDDWGYVRGLLGRLAPRDREVFELTVYGGLSPAEIAVRLGVERNAVDQAMFRARRALRELLDG